MIRPKSKIIVRKCDFDFARYDKSYICTDCFISSGKIKNQKHALSIPPKFNYIHSSCNENELMEMTYAPSICLFMHK